MTTQFCLCGSGILFNDCCEAYHRGDKYPATAEMLMRSRFTGYALQNSDYLLATWDKNTRPKQIDFSKEIAEWSGLEILMVKKGQIQDDKGLIEFKAYYRFNQQLCVLHELSRFKKSAGQWFYLDGMVKSSGQIQTKVIQGKNALCECGSGIKFKRCCGKNQ
ncbi:MAG: hypothetical protein RL637_1423 [Pseudomonadota bacterium]|jgi:SEC-C motif-containing protein